MEKICAEIMTHHLLSQAGIQKTPLRETVWSITDLLLIFFHWHRQNKMCLCVWFIVIVKLSEEHAYMQTYTIAHAHCTDVDIYMHTDTIHTVPAYI